MEYIRMAETQDEDDSVFEIYCSEGKVHRMKAETNEIAVEWIEALQSACDFVNGGIDASIAFLETKYAGEIESLNGTVHLLRTRVQELEEETEGFNSKLKEKDSLIEDLEDEIEEVKQNMLEKIKSLKEEMREERGKNTNSKDATIIQEKIAQIKLLEKNVETLKKEKKDLEKQVSMKGRKGTVGRKRRDSTSVVIDTTKVDELNGSVTKLSEKLDISKSRNSELEDMLLEKDSDMFAAKETIFNQEQRIIELEETNLSLSKEIEGLQNRIQKLKKDIEVLQMEKTASTEEDKDKVFQMKLETKDYYIYELEERLNHKEEELNELKESNSDKDSIIRSHVFNEEQANMKISQQALEIEKLKNQITEMTESLHENDLESFLSTPDDYLIQIQQLTSELKKRDSEIESLNEQLNSKKHKREIRKSQKISKKKREEFF
eukprot:TRINITY_DN5797_c0_g1_i1.p1 TRINITY_DN5797_c0_g1~~TRINITY_DN5797_c0_g1_i1.p1  ORF type:complete len:435 (-),score=137.06 TRINITY_DN5797_c0_g1_i1:805-2109(-)